MAILVVILVGVMEFLVAILGLVFGGGCLLRVRVLDCAFVAFCSVWFTWCAVI